MVLDISKLLKMGTKKSLDELPKKGFGVRGPTAIVNIDLVGKIRQAQGVGKEGFVEYNGAQEVAAILSGAFGHEDPKRLRSPAGQVIQQIARINKGLKLAGKPLLDFKVSFGKMGESVVKEGPKKGQVTPDLWAAKNPVMRIVWGRGTHEFGTRGPRQKVESEEGSEESEEDEDEEGEE